MRINDQCWLTVVDSFNAAAVSSGNWVEALSALAAATGSRVGELIGLGSANKVPFNWVSGLGPEWEADFLAEGGGDPAINPFVRMGSQMQVGQVLSSAEFISREERLSNRFIVEHTSRYDIPFICLSPLIKENHSLVGLAVMRGSKQGEITDQQKMLFSSIAPHVRAAVRTQIALEHQGAVLMAGALQALSLAVFVCDRRGHVKAMTPEAETLVRQHDGLWLRGGVLRGAEQTDTRALQSAIGSAAAGLTTVGPPISTTLVIRGQSMQPQVLEVLPVPSRQHAFGFEPRVLVVVRNTQPNPDRMQLLLRSAYGLTGAEADVAQRLACGTTIETVATERSASVATVRSQVRTIYRKLRVHRANELVARLNQLC